MMGKIKPKTLVVIVGLSAGLIVFYNFNFGHEPVYLRLMNAFSMTGLLNVFIGMWCAVRNAGQFRLLSHGRYTKHIDKLERGIKAGTLPDDTVIPTFDEFSTQKYEKKWNPWPFFAVGVPLFVIFLIMYGFY